MTSVEHQTTGRSVSAAVAMLGPVKLVESEAPADLFITNELPKRTPKKIDYLQEKLALQDLAAQMSDRPAQLLPRLVDLAIEITGGATGGLSLYEESPAPGVFRWHYLRGTLAKFNGGTTPRNFSPCGITLDNNAPVLSRRPERYYTWLADAGITLPECLLVPLYINGAVPLGTLWIASDREGHFDSGHARVMAELASFAGLAVRVLRTEESLERALHEQEMLALEMSHRVKNAFAVTAGLVQVSARAASDPTEMANILSGRLHALASAHALVHSTFDESGTTGQETSLEDVMRAITLPHESAPHRFTIGGPLVHLGDHATNSMALLFHELVTNAVKYGSLKAENGTVSVCWLRDNGDLGVVWREHGGPGMSGEPKSSGFGTRLAKGTVVDPLGGTISYDWLPDGLSVNIAVPLDRLSR